MRFLALFIFALATSTAALAQGQPIVRAEVKPETVNVGESAELTITVLVPTWFTRPSTYPSFELANAITRLPADSSYNIRERIGNESWSGIVRTYEIYPLLGATYRLSGLSVEVTYANPGGDPRTTAVKIPEVAIRGRVPAGAEALDPYIAGQSLSLRLDVNGELDSLEAGGAVVLEYVAELDGLPAIFIPPLAPDLEFDGVSVYADVPDVEDGTPARRSEKLTLVFDAGGEFSIPGREVEYWNTQSKSIEKAVAQGLVIPVMGPPVPIPAGDPSSALRWPRLIAYIAGAIALLVVAWRGAPVLARRYRDAAERRRQTERYAFTQLMSALASRENAAAYHALLHWIERLAPGTTLRSFVSDYGDESLSVEVAALSAGIYSNAATSGDLARIKSKLKKARKNYLERGSGQQVQSLPPLNP
jgi:hypothetical protein